MLSSTSSKSRSPPQDERARRKYSSSACLACRRSKIKCDNGRPRCSNCDSRKLDCVLGQDRRRASFNVKKSSGATAVSDPVDNHHYHAPQDPGREISSSASTHTPLAGSQVAFAQDYLLPVNGHPFDVTDAEFINYSDAGQDGKGDGLGYWFEMNGSEMDGQANHSTLLFEPLGNDSFSDCAASGILPALFTEHSDRAPAPGDAEAQADLDPHALFQDGGDQQLPLPLPLTDHSGSDSGQSGLSKGAQWSEDDPTEQLVSRLGRLCITEDGPRRYYGATSNLHLTQNPLVYCFQPAIRTLSAEGEAELERAGLRWERNADYEDHLTNLFFAWHNTCLYLVNEAIYYHHRALYRSGISTAYFSPTLENAILAVGAAYSSQRLPGVDDPPEFFAYRAKVLLEIELDNPNMATLQALGTLSIHEGAFGRDSRGWLYMGMAIQLLSDLGMHLDLDATCDSDEDSHEMRENSNLRRTMFWSTQALDTMWSAYSGRPCSMRYEDSPVPAPQPVRTRPWKAYIDPTTTLRTPESLDSYAVFDTHIYMAQLCSKIRKISKLLYTGPQASIPDTDLFGTSMTRELRCWYECLPPHLTVDASLDKDKPALPAVLILHMQYHEVMIMLHRPFISGPADHARSEDSVLKDSGDICEASATAICRLLVMYRHQWGIRFVHPQVVPIILTAAMIHVHNCCIYSSEKGMRAQDNISICFSALGEMSYFNIGTRSLETILSLRRDWQSRTFNRIGKKRLGDDMQRRMRPLVS